MELTQILFAVFSETAEAGPEFVHTFADKEKAASFCDQHNRRYEGKILYYVIEYLPSRRL